MSLSPRDWLEMLQWPAWLLAIPLPWLLRALLPPPIVQGASLRLPIADRIRELVGPPSPGIAGRGIGWLAGLAWVLLCIAAARPQELGPPVQPPTKGRDLMLALDLSGSMNEPDMEIGGNAVDRLTAAKAVLSDFIDRRAGDRLSLLVFGRQAHVLTPFTLDRESVRDQLADSVVGLAGQETAIGDAIGLAVRRLRAEPGGQRVLVLLTDGVNTAGLLDPRRAARIAADAGVRIHTVAFGGDGAVSLFGFRLPTGGDDEIDEATLRAIAGTTGGRFFRARDTDELAGIYAEIDRLEPIARPGRAVRPRIERYMWPLGAAFALALLAALKGRRT
ncbi:vWA domain-containing protein [Cognatilysobacter lacus]|uniref:VWA domain-containing protein n=1 Tax=Cognatilysobacter lacus TaxID=1643323 RepID=A0A5D8Z1D7_9GAMM|nr:VWA domain-containing protein [Lysobacter lacus]TZF88561.1 VWA domain-containing protein [Lysobacter lacus]